MRSYDLTILQVITNDGESHDGGDYEDYLEEADSVFYSISYANGEEFYRWVYGPFEDLDTLEAIIDEDVDFYSEAVAV